MEQVSNDFEQICDLLKKHGELILKTINERSLLLSDGEGNAVDLDCYGGMSILSSLFGFHRFFKTRDPILEPDLYKAMVLDSDFVVEGSHFEFTPFYIEKHGVNKVLEPGYIHFCQFDSKDSEGDYGSDQTHFFVLIYDKEVTLLQAFGQVPGLTVKKVQGDINHVIQRLLKFDHQLYKQLFELPEDNERSRFSHLLNFDETAFRVVSIPLAYPTLADFRDWLKIYNLNL